MRNEGRRRKDEKLPLKFVDPKVVLDESEQWGKLYNEIIARQSR